MYMLFYEFVDDIRERRGAYRDEHLELAGSAHDRGELLMAGALGEPADGAVLIFRDEGKAAAEQFVAKDPYVTHGLVTSWRIRPWNVLFGG